MSSSRNKSLVKRINAGVKRINAGIGIDVSSDIARIIHVEQADGMFAVASWTVINAAQEGLINGDELADATARWLREHSLENLSICTTLPQNATTESVVALPANIPESELRNMVSLQAHTLCNISDEQFLFEFQLQETREDECSVLVSLIRESAVNEHFQLLTSHNVPVTQMTSHGLAAVNALLALHPAEARDDRMQLVLNVERDYSTLSALCNGKLLFQSWLCYTSEMLLQDADEAIAALKTEMSNVLQHWYDSAGDSMDAGLPAKIWITGEGAAEPVFQEKIAAAFPKMSIKLLGVRILQSQQDSTRTSYIVHTELTVAFGLAVQAMGLAAVQLSIIPALAKWQLEKRLRFHWLAMAATTLTIGLAILYAGLYARIQNKLEYVRHQTMELQTCLQLAPKIDQIHAKQLHLQKQMLPVAEAAFRTRRFVNALQCCDAAMGVNAEKSRQNWGIYLADEFSFQKANGQKANGQDPAEEQTNARKNTATKDYALTTSDTFPTDLYHATLPKLEADADKTTLTLVGDMKLLTRLYLGGITPLGESRYKVVKEIQTRLQMSGEYRNVDDHIDFLVNRFNDKYFAPWLTFLRDNKATLDNDFTIFFLEIPFAREYINSSLLAGKDLAQAKSKGWRAKP